MSETPSPLDLSSLEHDYEIVGELNTQINARAYIASRKDPGGKRRDDHTRVVITISVAPEGDEGNALSHFAADTRLLARLKHRRLVPIVEGQWVGTDAFAVITERSNDTSLAAVLARAERFTNPRIAALLREVDGLLEWAREQKVMHRLVTPDSIFLEPQTDRVSASFVIAPFARRPRSDVDTDARTIARLAIAMLTGDAGPRSLDAASLQQDRPDLPDRIVEVTSQLLGDVESQAASNIASYLALIGMAGPIAAEESELERLRSELLEEQRLDREKLAAERAMGEKTMADERAHFEKTVAAERGRFATERADFLRAVEREHEELVARRAELEKEADERKVELERAAAHDRQLIVELRENIRRAGELEIEKKRQAALEDIVDSDADTDSILEQNELAIPPLVLPEIMPLRPLVFADDRPWLPDAEGVVPATRDYETSGTIAGVTPADGAPGRPRSRTLLFALAGVALVLVTAAAALGSRYASRSAAATPTPAVATAPVLPAPLAAPVSAVPLPAPGATIDSSVGLDSAVAAARVTQPERRRPVDSVAVSDSSLRADSLRSARRAARARRDSVRKRDSLDASKP